MNAQMDPSTYSVVVYSVAKIVAVTSVVQSARSVTKELASVNVILVYLVELVLIRLRPTTSPHCSKINSNLRMDTPHPEPTYATCSTNNNFRNSANEATQNSRTFKVKSSLKLTSSSRQYTEWSFVTWTHLARILSHKFWSLPTIHLNLIKQQRCCLCPQILHNLWLFPELRAKYHRQLFLIQAVTPSIWKQTNICSWYVPSWGRCSWTDSEFVNCFRIISFYFRPHSMSHPS